MDGKVNASYGPLLIGIMASLGFKLMLSILGPTNKFTFHQKFKGVKKKKEI